MAGAAGLDPAAGQRRAPQAYEITAEGQTVLSEQRARMQQIARVGCLPGE